MAQSQESALGIRPGSVASFEVNMSRRALMTAPEGQLERLPTLCFLQDPFKHIYYCVSGDNKCLSHGAMIKIIKHIKYLSVSGI